MPLPDADKKSPRVYTLSQNTDLENMAFATLQSIGQPINIEEMNEDELRRLVLVNLARLAVKGEWDGLLEAGASGSAYNVTQVALGATAQFDMWNIATQWQGGDAQHVALTLGAENQLFYPYIAPVTGAPSACTIYVSSAVSQNVYIGFYSNSNGAPATMLGYATISTSSTGAIRVTSFTEASTGSLTFTRGTQYWYTINKSGTLNPYLSCVRDDNCAAISPDNVATNSNGRQVQIESVSTTTSAPADVAVTDIQGGGTGGN